MTETTEPTRERIALWLDHVEANDCGPEMSTDNQCAVLRLALRTLDAEAKLAAMTERAEKAERLLTHVYDQLIKDGRLTDALGMILNEVGATVTLYGTEHPTYEALRSRCEIAEAAIARMQHLHRTKPDEALDRATIRRVAEDDGLVHSADVLRLLADVEKAERERDEARGDLKHEREARGIVERELREARRERDEATERAEKAERDRDEWMRAAREDLAEQRRQDVESLRSRVAELEHEASRLRDTYRALRRTMHRRAQRAESATAAARREAIGQRKRADWWRGKAKQIEAERAEEHEALVEDAKHHGPLDAERAARLRYAVGVLTERESEAEERARMAQHDLESVQRQNAELRTKLNDAERRIAELSPPTTDARLDCESSSLLLLSTWARRVMMRKKNRDKGVPSESVEELIEMAHDELTEALWAIEDGATHDDILAELGDAAAYIAFAMRKVESRRNR